MSKAWEGGSTAAWRKTRAAVLLRDGYQCMVRTDVCVGDADCVHHLLGRSVSGDDPAYLTACCTPCNLRLGDVTKRKDPPPRPTTKW